MAFNCQADLEYYNWPQCLSGVSGPTGYEIQWDYSAAMHGFMACTTYNGMLEDEGQCNNTLSFQNEYNPCPCNGFYQTDGDTDFNYPMWSATPGDLKVGSGYCCQYYENADDAEPSTCGNPVNGVEGACSCLNGPQGNMCNDSGKVGTQVSPESPGELYLNSAPLEQDCYCDPECVGRGDCCKAYVCSPDGSNCILKDMREVECDPIDTNVYGCMDEDASNFFTQPACGNEGFCEDTLLECTPGGDTSNCGDGAICYTGCPDGCVEGECPDTPVTEMCDYEGCIYYCLKDDDPFWCQSEESTWRYPYGDGETPWPSGVPCPCPGDAVNYMDLIQDGFTLFSGDELQFSECNLCYDNVCTLHNLSTCDPVLQSNYRWYTDFDGDGIGCCNEMTYQCSNDPSTSIWKVQECGETGNSCNCPGNNYDQCGICNGTNQCVGCLDPLACNYRASYTNDCSGNGNGAPGYDFGPGGFLYYVDILADIMYRVGNAWLDPDADTDCDDGTCTAGGGRILMGCGPYGLSEGFSGWQYNNEHEWCSYENPTCDCLGDDSWALVHDDAPGCECNPGESNYQRTEELYPFFGCSEGIGGDGFAKGSGTQFTVRVNKAFNFAPSNPDHFDFGEDIQACIFYFKNGVKGGDYFGLSNEMGHSWSFSDSKIEELCNIFALGESNENHPGTEGCNYVDGYYINYRSINTLHYRKQNYYTVQGNITSCSQDYGESNSNCNGFWATLYGDTDCCQYLGSEPFICDCDGTDELTYYNDTNDWDGLGCSELSNEFCEGQQPNGWVIDGTGSCEQCPYVCDGEGGGVNTGSESCVDDCGVCNGNSYCDGDMDYQGGTCDGTFIGDNFDCSGECFGDLFKDFCGVCGGTNFDPEFNNCCLDTENPDNCVNKVWITYPDGTSADNAILKPGDFIGVKVQIYSIDNPVHSITTKIEAVPGQDFGHGTIPYEDVSVQYIGDGMYQSVQNYYIQDDLISGPSGNQVSGDWSNTTDWMNTKFRLAVSAKESLYQSGDGYLGNDSQCELPDGTLGEDCNNVGIDFKIGGVSNWNQMYTWWDGNTGQTYSCGDETDDCIMGICANGNQCSNPNLNDPENCGDINPYCNPGPCWGSNPAGCTVGYSSFLTNTWSTETQSFIADGGPNIEVNENDDSGGFPIVINYLYQGIEYDESQFTFEWNQTSGVDLAYNDNFNICNSVPNCRWFDIGVPGIRTFDLLVKDSNDVLLGQADLQVTIVGQNRSSQLDFKNINIKSKKDNFIDKKLRNHKKLTPVKSSSPKLSINPNIDSSWLNCLYQFPNGIFGDVDNNNKINVTDIVKVIQNIDDLSLINECAPFFADMNQDGVVDISDIMTMVNHILGRWNQTSFPTDDIYQEVRREPKLLGCPSKYPNLLNNGEPYINHDWDCWDDDQTATSCNGCYDMPESGWAWVCQNDLNGTVYPNDPNCGGTDCSCIIRPDYVCKLDPNGDTYYPTADETCDTDGYRNPLCGTNIETPIMDLGCLTDGIHDSSNDGDCINEGDECNYTETEVPIYEEQCIGLPAYNWECESNPEDGCFYGMFECGQVQVDTNIDGGYIGTCGMYQSDTQITPFECTTQCKTFGLDSTCGGQCPGEHVGNYCIDRLEHCCLHDFPKQWTDTFNSYVQSWNGLPSDYQMNFELMRCDDDSLSTCQNVGDFGPERNLENPGGQLFGTVDYENTNFTKSPYTIPIISVFGADCSDGDRLIECSKCTDDTDCDIRGILPRFESLPPVGFDQENFQHISTSEVHNNLLEELTLTAGSLFSGYICSGGPYDGQACQEHYGVAGTGCGTELNEGWEGWENQTDTCETSGFCSWTCNLNPLTQGPPTIYQKLVRGTHYSYTGGNQPSFDDGNITMASQLYWDNTTYPAPYPTWDGTSPLYNNVPISMISSNPYPIILNDGFDGDVDDTPIYSFSIKNKVQSDTHEKIYLKLYDPFYEQEYPLGCMKILSGGNYGSDNGVNEIKYHIYSDVNICNGSLNDNLYQGECSHDNTINCENDIDCRIKVSVTTVGGDAILSPGNCFKHGCTDADGSEASSAGYPNHPNGQPACNYDGEAEVDDGSCIYQTKWYHDFDEDGLTNCDSAFVVQCEQPNGYYQCDCCDSGNCNDDPVCNDPNDYCTSNEIDDCGVCDGPDYCNGNLVYDDSIDAVRCICEPGDYPCWTTGNDISSCDSSVGFDCRGVCGTGWVTDPCGIGATDGSFEFSIANGFGGNCVPCFDRDGDGDGLDYNKISCRLDYDNDGHPCDDDIGDPTCINTYMCPGYNHIYDNYDECPCPIGNDGSNCYQLHDYVSDPNDTCEHGYWDNCGHCSSLSADISLYNDCREDVECFDDQNGHKTDNCGNCMTMTCCDITSGSCPVGSYTPSYDGNGWRLANGNYIFDNPCAEIWGDNYVPGNLNWNIGCVDCGGLYNGSNVSDTTGHCDSAEASLNKCSMEAHCCSPGSVDNCGVCNSAGILNTEYIFFRDWDRDDIPYAESHDFICVKSNTIGGTPDTNGSYVVHGHTPINPYFDGGFENGGINVLRYETCTNPVLEGSNYSCYDDINWDCPDELSDDCNGQCGGSAVVDECGVCGGTGYTDYWVNLGNIGDGWGSTYQHCTSTMGEPYVSWLGSCMNNSSWTTSNSNNNQVFTGCWNQSADNYVCNLYPCLPDCEDNIQGTVITTMNVDSTCAFLNLLLPYDVEQSGYSFNVQLNGGTAGDVSCDGTEFEGSTCWNNIDVSGTHSMYGQFARIKIYELSGPGGSKVGEPIENISIGVDSTSPISLNLPVDQTCDCGDGITFECECYDVGKYYQVIALYPDPDGDDSVETCTEENISGCVGYDTKEFLFDSSTPGCTDDGSLPSCQTICNIQSNECVGGPCISWDDPDNSLNDGVFSGDEICSSFTEGQSCQTTQDCIDYTSPIHYQNCFPNRPPTKDGTFDPYGTDTACDYNPLATAQTSCQYKTWLCTDSDDDGYACIDDKEWLCSPQTGFIDCSLGNTESGTAACSCSAQSSIIDIDPNHRVMWGSWELGMEGFGYINGDWLGSGFGYNSETNPADIYSMSSGQCISGPDIGQDITYGDGDIYNNNPDLYNICPSEINPSSGVGYIIGETIPGFVDNCEVCQDPMCAPAGLGVSYPLYNVENINPNNFIDLHVYGWNNEQWGVEGESNNPCSVYDSNDPFGNGFVPTNPNWNKSCTGCTDPNSDNFNPDATRPCTGAVTTDGNTLNGELTEYHYNPNPTCPGRCQFNPTRKCTQDSDCSWNSPCDNASSEVNYGTCNFGQFTYVDPGDGTPVFNEYLNEVIDPQGPNCCCETMAATCPDPCSPDYEPGTTTDCMGNQLKNCMFGFNENGLAIDSMFSGLNINIGGGSNTSENSLVDIDWPGDWPLNVNVGDYIRVGVEVMEVESLSTYHPQQSNVSITVNRGLFGTDSSSSYSNEKAYVEHPSFCNYQCCQPYETESCMDPNALNFYCWGYYGYLINDYRLCPEYGRIPNCDIEIYGDLCENVIDGTSNDNWERKLIKPCNGDNSCCEYQHDCSGNICNGRECDKRTGNSWFDFCGNCITPEQSSTEGWANIGCGCNTTLGDEGDSAPTYFLDTDMDGFGCSNLILTPNIAGELTIMYQQYGQNLGRCISNPTTRCFSLDNPIHNYGECGTFGGDIDECKEDTGNYSCDDGSGTGIFIDGSDCAGFGWGWEYCDESPRWYIKEDTVMGHSGNSSDLWWYNLQEDGLECTTDADCAVHNPHLWDCWITQGEGCDLMPFQEGICESGHCQHPGFQSLHETMPMCVCETNDYDCEGNCVTNENTNPLRFDSCQDCGGTSFGCSRLVCKYQGMSICYTNGQPDETNFIGDGAVCEDYCCNGGEDCDINEYKSYWIYNGERTVITCEDQLSNMGVDVATDDSCNMSTGFCNIQNTIECTNDNFCNVKITDFLWIYNAAAQTGINEDELGGLKNPDTEPGYHNETFYCDFYHPDYSPLGNPYSKYDCNCDCNGSAFLDDCGVCVGINGITGMQENNITDCKHQAGCEYDPDMGEYCQGHSIDNAYRYGSKGWDDRGIGFTNWVNDGFGPDLDCNCDCKPHTLKGKYTTGQINGVPEDQIIPWYGKAHIDFPMGDEFSMGGSNISYEIDGFDPVNECGSLNTQPYLCNLSCGCAGGNTFPSYKRIQQELDTDEDGIIDIIHNEGGLGHKYCFTCFERSAVIGYNPQKYSHCTQFGGGETCYSASPAVGEGFQCTGFPYSACDPLLPDWANPEGCGNCQQTLSIYAEDVACQNYGCGDRYSLNYESLSWGGLKCINSWLWNEGEELYQWPIELPQNALPNVGKPWQLVDTRESEYAGYSIKGSNGVYDYVMGEPILEETQDGSGVYEWTGDDCDGCSLALGGVIKGRDWSCQPGAIPFNFVEEVQNWYENGYGNFDWFMDSFSDIQYAGINWTSIKDDIPNIYNPVEGMFYGGYWNDTIYGFCGSGGDGEWSETTCNTLFPWELKYQCVGEFEWSIQSGECETLPLDCVERLEWDEIIVDDVNENCADGVVGDQCGASYQGTCKIHEDTCNNTYGCRSTHIQELCDASGHCKWKYPYFGWGQECGVHKPIDWMNSGISGKIGLRAAAPMGVVPSCVSVLGSQIFGEYDGDWDGFDNHEVYRWHSMVLGGGSDIQNKYQATPGGTQFPNLPDAMWKLGLQKRSQDFTFRMQIPPEIMFQGFDDNEDANITHLAVTFGDTNRYQNAAVIGDESWVTECEPSDNSITAIFDFTDLGSDILDMLAGNIIFNEGQDNEFTKYNQAFTVRAGWEGASITFADQTGSQLVTSQISYCIKNGSSQTKMLAEGIKNAIVSVRKHHYKPDVTCSVRLNERDEYTYFAAATLSDSCATEFNGLDNNPDNLSKSRVGVALDPDSMDYYGYKTYGICTTEYGTSNLEATCLQSMCPLDCGDNNTGVKACSYGSHGYDGSSWRAYSSAGGGLNFDCRCRCDYERSTFQYGQARFLEAPSNTYDCALGSWGWGSDWQSSNYYARRMGNFGPFETTDASYKKDNENMPADDYYIWFDNFRIQSSRKSGQLGMIEINRFQPINAQWGEDQENYCCLPSWCGGVWDGHYCTDCICEDNHSIWNNSFEISFMDDAKICGLTQGNPGHEGACADWTNSSGIQVNGNGIVGNYNSALTTSIEPNHPLQTLWKFTDENETYVDSCGSDGGSSGMNVGHLQNWAWQPGEMIKADNDCVSKPGSIDSGERYDNEGGDYSYGCGKTTTFKLYEFPNLKDPCYDVDACDMQESSLLADGDAGVGQPDGDWCVKDSNGDGIYENCFSSQACEGTCTESPYYRWKDTSDSVLKPDYLEGEARDWQDITRRWDREKDFLDHWNTSNYDAARAVLDEYWHDDGYYYFIVKTEGSQGYYTTSDGGEIYDWLSSQENNLNNCGTWCMGGLKRRGSYTAFPVSKKIIKQAWGDEQPKPQVLIWANNGDMTNDQICNDVYYNQSTDFDGDKVDCHVFDIPEDVESEKNNGEGGAGDDLPSHTSCGGGHWLEGDTNHSWSQYPPNWGTREESVWNMGDELPSETYHVAFSVTIWPPSYIHSKGVDWQLQPFGDE